MFPMTGVGLTLRAHTARLSVRLEPVMHAHFFGVCTTEYSAEWL